MSSFVFQVTGRPPIHDQTVTVTGEQNAYTGLTTGQGAVFGRMSTAGTPNTFYEETIEVQVPGRLNEVAATFPASNFTSDVFRIGLEVSVPRETRGGEPMVEVWAPEIELEQQNLDDGRIRVASFRAGEAQFFDNNDKAWTPLSLAFLSRQQIVLYVSGFSSFGTWTEPRTFTLPVTLRLRAWGES